MHSSVALINLIDALVAKQGRETDIIFAKKLGISRQTWAAYKAETRKPSGLDFYTNVVKIFPDLQVLTYTVVYEGDTDKVDTR